MERVAWHCFHQILWPCMRETIAPSCVVRQCLPTELEGGSVWHLGAIGLANSIATSRPITSFWQMKPVAITQRNRRLLRHTPPQVQSADSSPLPGVKTPLPAFQRSPSKGRLSIHEHRGKGLGTRRPKAGTNRSGSTGLMAALIARDSARTDCTYVRYLQDPKPRL